MVFRNKNFLILGGGRSGEAMTGLLTALGARVFCYDQDAGKVKRLEALGAAGRGETEGALSGIYAVAVSPGVPVTHPVIEEAERRGIRVLGETELGFLLCRAPVLAITGTNGKSTTVSLLHELLKCGGLKSRLLGNIGRPLSAEALETQPDEAVCLEVSSFQLETVHQFAPHIAAVLNVTRDHLDRHGTMERYRALKYRVFARQTASEYAVLNADEAEIAALGKSLASDVYYFSTRGEVRGSYSEDGKLYFQDGPVREYIADSSELLIPGEHNLSNALCAVTFARLMGVSPEKIREGLTAFPGIRHRVQYAGEVNGKAFYNDSKGTNIGAALVAARAMNRPTALLLGGSGKGYEFDELFRSLPESVVHTVFFGDTRYKLLEAAVRCGWTKLSVAQEMNSAIRIGYFAAPPGGAVLLSPACASFDQFQNYAERGDRFLAAVEDLRDEI